MGISSFEPFRVYWKLYGGTHDLVRSPYLWTAIISNLLCCPFWLSIADDRKTRPATDLVLSIVPSLMSFTLGGMAILLALSGGKFLDAIREGGDERSLFLKIVALFFHFLIVETAALLLALLSKAYPASAIIAAPMFFLMVYGITSAVSIASMLINVARIYNLTGSGDGKG